MSLVTTPSISHPQTTLFISSNISSAHCHTSTLPDHHTSTLYILLHMHVTSHVRRSLLLQFISQLGILGLFPFWCTFLYAVIFPFLSCSISWYAFLLHFDVTTPRFPVSLFCIALRFYFIHVFFIHSRTLLSPTPIVACFSIRTSIHFGVHSARLLVYK